jgi:UDP-N-acetylglucosamine acyltransferase
MGVHSTAIVDVGAQIGEDVEIGPHTVIGPGVRIGARTRIGSSVLIERDTTVGEGCRIHHGAVLGSDPQDLKYNDEPARLEVGDRTTIREYATLNRGTAAAGKTVVGSDCLLMAYTHVAHDCILGDHVILANSVNMGGHVEIGDWATIGGLTGMHQFVRIGAYAFLGGASRIPKDVAPYSLVAGNPARLAGINSVGLERRGFSEETRRTLKSIVRELSRSQAPMAEVVASTRAGVHGSLPEVVVLLDFIESSTRGITLR